MSEKFGVVSIGTIGGQVIFPQSQVMEHYDSLGNDSGEEDDEYPDEDDRREDPQDRFARMSERDLQVRVHSEQVGRLSKRKGVPS